MPRISEASQYSLVKEPRQGLGNPRLRRLSDRVRTLELSRAAVCRNDQTRNKLLKFRQGSQPLFFNFFSSPFREGVWGFSFEPTQRLTPRTRERDHTTCSMKVKGVFTFFSHFSQPHICNLILPPFYNAILPLKHPNIFSPLV